MSYLRSALVFLAALGLMVLIVSFTGTTTADSGIEEKMAALSERVTELENEVATLKTSVRSNHPDPLMEQAATVAFQSINALIRSGNVAEAKPKLAAFVKEYGNTRAGRQARSVNDELAVVGKSSPDDWAIDQWFQGEGDIDLDGSGPTVLVFWETWCPHCRREVPKLQKLHADYRERGLQILGLSKLTRGASETTVKSFIDEHGIEFSMAKENGKLSSHFGVGGIPAVAVVKDHKVVWRGHPARLTTTMLEAWME